MNKNSDIINKLLLVGDKFTPDSFAVYNEESKKKDPKFKIGDLI